MSIKIWVKNPVKWVRKGGREMLEASSLGQPCLLRQPCWLAPDPPRAGNHLTDPTPTTLLVGQAIGKQKAAVSC